MTAFRNHLLKIQCLVLFPSVNPSFATKRICAGVAKNMFWPAMTARYFGFKRGETNQSIQDDEEPDGHVQNLIEGARQDDENGGHDTKTCKQSQCRAPYQTNRIESPDV